MGAAVAIIAGSIIAGMLAPKPETPDFPQLAPPTPAEAPEAPEPVVQAASEEPVIDSEAARVRATKRRRASEESKLFPLSSTDDDAVVLTKSLLGN